MNLSPLTPLEKRIRLAAIVNLIALVGTIVSLLWQHPLSFIEFAVVGLLLMLFSIVYYLLALVRVPRKSEVSSE